MASSTSAPCAVAGIRLAATASGARYQDRDDLVLIEIADGARTACVYTTNRFCAAPVTICRRHEQVAQPRYLIINAGNANAGTGDAGERAALEVCAAVAECGGCSIEQVLPFSTGVIGEQLDSKVLIDSLPALFESLQQDNWSSAANGILTTDTRAKMRTAEVELDGQTVHVAGIVKGSGMIRPDMATMLAYVATDAPFERTDLQNIARKVAERSFNCITVDGDTSTNDAFALISTGNSGESLSPSSGSAYDDVVSAIETVCIELAKDIVRDGEGATKFVTVRVQGGASESDCRNVAFTVAQSPLVKTALFASDPNWGRILAAAGRTPDTDFSIDDIDISIGGHAIIAGGQPSPTYEESIAAKLMSEHDIEIEISIGAGSTTAEVWTCDFSYDYVRINAEYRS